MAKPPVPETLNAVPFAEQTDEQLQIELTWWQWKSTSAREEATREWAAGRLKELEEEIASR